MIDFEDILKDVGFAYYCMERFAKFLARAASLEEEERASRIEENRTSLNAYGKIGQSKTSKDFSLDERSFLVSRYMDYLEFKQGD